MDVITFEKSMMDRLVEAQNILVTNKKIPTSRVREEWSYGVELLIEPAGWQAMWRISRVVCEEFKIKYPTSVYGTVTNVLYKELKATFYITAVQDADINLPDEHEVRLEDLWPLKIQENPSINIESTANAVDMIRFFFKNLWMPWDGDNDEDIDWPTKYLESRIRLCYDLIANMNPILARRIRALIAEARDIQERRECLEIDLSDDEDMDSSKSQITDLMHLHVRLATIRHEIETLENPKLRKIVEEIKFPDRNIGEISVVLRSELDLSQQINDLEIAKRIIGEEKPVKMSLSLQDCLMTCGSAGKIYLTGGPHCIKFLDTLSNSIIGILPCDNSEELMLNIDVDESKQSVIKAKDFENILLTLNGSLEINNVILDCRKARTGILIREGSVHFKNCTIVGNQLSSTSTAIIMLEKTTVSVENCVIKDFATAISMRSETTSSTSTLFLTNSILHNNSTGIECTDESCITFQNSKICDSSNYGIIATSNKSKVNKLLQIEIKEMRQHGISVNGDCDFQKCSPGNIILYNTNETCLIKRKDDTTSGVDENLYETDCSAEMENETTFKIDDSVVIID